MRLARNARDYINLAIFLRELSTTQEEFSRALYNDISGLKEEAQVLLGDTAQKRWLTTHTLDFSLLPDKPDHNVLRVSAGELDSEIKQLENSISGMVVPPNMHPFDAAAFTDKINTQKANRLREALAKRVNDSTSKDLLEAELEALGNFLKRLNDLASKGVHASVALAEAKQGLVGLYFFLFNFSQNLWRNKEP